MCFHDAGQFVATARGLTLVLMSHEEKLVFPINSSTGKTSNQRSHFHREKYTMDEAKLNEFIGKLVTDSRR